MREMEGRNMLLIMQNDGGHRLLAIIFIFSKKNYALFIRTIYKNTSLKFSGKLRTS